ncbi:MAG: indole-3-glycerol phosphate synthase TrpC [Nevskia sp.]|jgi:indole-3-glycerol phosphate synthase|nr:indole-3-glycerol phosphate synthase TrpC [Nevskia sp.]
MSDILQTILARKADEIAALAKRFRLADLERIAASQPAPRGFAAALTLAVQTHGAGVIAEIKKASPSKGLIRADFDPGWLARDYAAGGAACLSVLTDEHFFQGHNDYLVEARQHCSLPVIRKDFLIDPLQVAEARAIGADCVLLIAAALAPAHLAELAAQARELEMDVLIEIHDRAELDAMLQLNLPAPTLLGINNRNLRTFETSLETTLALLSSIPNGYDVVTESGIATPADVLQMTGAGVQRFLVGESLMRQPSPGAALSALLA